MKPGLAYYISAHGYGHGVRSSDILRAFIRGYPGIPVVIVSDLPGPFLRNRLAGAPADIRPGSFDVGMVQLDSVRVDVPATLDRVRALCGRREELVGREARFLREREVGLVVADIPAMPLEAARRAGIPAVAVGNFGWNWIYEEFIPRDPRWAEAAAAFREGYARADVLLRLPFHEPMAAFRRIEDIPLVAAPGRARREELAALTGARPDRTWVLLSFTTLEWDGAALDRVERLGAYEFFTVRPLEWSRRNVHAVDRERMPFSDVLASADLVVSKPGFGLVSECVVNRKPLVYVDRADFREHPILEAGVKRFLKHRLLPADRLYAGDLEEALDAIVREPEPADELPGGGAEIAARRLAERLDPKNGL
ncbi:MAG TPA: hypothetical protein P5567_13900 [Kiritimatiellia bacterium]|nr:hypothetical protein [Kiritimatiellia bacterium]HRZ13535.1 hypothetical protein [Kiritimatiellia bacterium]HSA19160.1 hypothetical protein [Kiritimatiellia bacterium]